MNSSRGTRSMARRTFSSTMSRARSWRSTMSRRSSGCCMRGTPIGQLDAEVLDRERRDVDDPPRKAVPEPDGQHGNLRVAELERAVAAAAKVAAPREIGELDTDRRRDDQLARIRVRERAPGSLERVGLVEQGLVAARLPASGGRPEAKLFAVAPRDYLVAFPVEDDFSGRTTVEAPSQRRGVPSVDHPRAVRGGDDDVIDPGEARLQGGDALDRRLAVIGADDHRVPLEKLVRAAGRLDQRPDRRVAARERLPSGARPEHVRGEVVVGQVVEEEVEAVAGPEPAPDRGVLGG